MLLNLEDLIKKYKLSPDSVLHVGAHYGQESSIYDNINIPINNRHYFEPQPDVFKILDENVVGNKYNFALGSENKVSRMFVEKDNQSMSSSILEPSLHTKQYPHIRFTDEIEVKVFRLNDVWCFGEFYGDWLLNIDVQGYELEVLKGSTKILPYTSCIILEVNRAEVYKGCPHVDDLDKFLYSFKFKRVETNWEGVTWGDAFYVKE